MRQRLFSLLSVIILSACQARAPLATPTSPAVAAPAITPTDLPTSGSLFFHTGFQMFDSQGGWAWQGISQLYRTDDGGLTWKEIHLQDRMQVEGASFVSAQEAWLPGVPDSDLMQAVYHTSDGGKTWTELARLRGPNISLSFHDPKTGWALNGIGATGNIFYQVYQTLDGGQSWTQLQPATRAGEQPGAPPNTIRVATGESISFMPPDTIWITSGYGTRVSYAGVRVSRDGGRIWQELNLPLPAPLIADQPPIAVYAPQFISDQVAYLPVGVSPRLVFFVSRDSGATWTPLPSVLQAGDPSPRVQFINMENGFAVCGSNLCSTQDGAATWKEIATPFSFKPTAGGPQVLQWDFIDATTGWAILDHDGGSSLIKTTDGGRTWIDLEPRLGF